MMARERIAARAFVMASGAARRKRKREHEKVNAWTRLAAHGGDAAALEREEALERGRAEREAAAARLREDVLALDRSAERGRGDRERGGSTSGASASARRGAVGGLANAVGVPARVARDSPHATRVLCSATSDGARVFACAHPRRWGRRGIEHIARALGFEVTEYEEVTLSKAPELAACVIRPRALANADDSSTKKKKKTSVGGGVKASVAEAFLARAEALREPIQAPDVDDDDDGARGAGGLNAWVAAHRRRRAGGAKEATKKIDAWFEKKEMEEQAVRDAEEAAKADDGWTVVQAKRGRRKTTADDESGTTVGGIRAATANGRRKEIKKIANEEFYRFQSKEKKRSEIMELQAKFELDKQRIARLKAARKFRPL